MAHSDTVKAWFNERLSGGALARDTEAYNQVFAELPNLIARLDPEAVPAQIAAEAVPEAPATESAAG